MQQGQVSSTHVVEVHLDFAPVELRGVVERLALGLVVDERGVMDVSGAVEAATKLPSEQVDAHYAEDEPEDEADQQDVHDGGDGPDQGVHHHLQRPTVTRPSNTSNATVQTKHRTSAPMLVRFNI